MQDEKYLEVEVHVEYVLPSSVPPSILLYFSVYFFYATVNNPRCTVRSDVALRSIRKLEGSKKRKD